MSKPKHTRWRVVYGVGDMTGVTFVNAADDVEANRTVRADVKARLLLGEVVIYSVMPDVDPLAAKTKK